MKQFLILLLLSANTFAQLSPPNKTPIQKHKEIPEFMGIEVDGTMYDIKSQFEAKGFKVKESTKTTLYMTGTLIGDNLEIVASFTPTTKKCYQIAVFMPKENNWYDIKAEYKKYVKLLTDKYGTPTDKFEFFESPYYEGDGYEMSAVGLEKCTYFTYWKKGYGVQISKYKQIKITYENMEMSDQQTEEKEAIDKNIF